MSRLKAPGSAGRLVRPVSGIKPPTSGLAPPSTASVARKSSASNEAVDSNIVQSPFEIGDRVMVGGVKPGTVSFIGPAKFAPGIWAGIVLDTAEGKNSGSVNGVSYFQCAPNHGLFAKPDKLTLVRKAGTQSMVPKQAPPPPPSEIEYEVGDKVIVDGSKTGTVAFVGPTQFAKGIWIGVTLDTPEGKNNGAVAGIQYFNCLPNHGLFTRPAKLALVRRKSSEASLPPPLTMPVKDHPPPSSGGMSVDELRAKAEQLHNGDRVIVHGTKQGTIQFIGQTHFAKGLWVGVELDEAQGKNDGAVSGKRYFQCEPLHGLFAPLPKVDKINKESTPPAPSNRRLSGRGMSGSPGSSISSLSSVGRIRPIQQPLVEPDPMPSPVSITSGNGALSHIMFEKDHQIATLQSSLEQAELDRVKLSEEVTELRRQVDDLLFRLEEQSVISGDQLEEVSTREQSELILVQEQLLQEKQKTSSIENELTSTRQQIENLLSEKSQLTEELTACTQKLNDKDSEIQKLEKEKEHIRTEANKTRDELKSAEVDFISTDEAARTLQANVDTIQLQLQEALDVCAQQENLLEEKVKEIQDLDDNIKQLQKELENMTSEKQELLASQKQIASERDQALAQSERLMAESSSTSNEQSQLAQQYKEILQERDGLKQELRDTLALLEKVSTERDNYNNILSELKSERQEIQTHTQEVSLKFENVQKELTDVHSELEKSRRESRTLTEELDQVRMSNEQKYGLMESTCAQLRQRLDQANKERDLALQNAQELADELELLTKERDNLIESGNQSYQQIEALQYQLEEMAQNYHTLTSQNQSDILQAQLEETEERLEQKIRELQETKEKVSSLEEELVIQSSLAPNEMHLTSLEEKKLSLEEKVAELTMQLKEAQRRGGSESGDVNESIQAEKVALETALYDKDQEVIFLNSVIADLQTKIEALESLNGLGDNAGALVYLDSSEDDIGGQLPPPRLFCDICDEFDQHDTADCPLQAQSESPPPTMHHGIRSHERPYCENCEVFGHWTEDCEYEETY